MYTKKQAMKVGFVVAIVGAAVMSPAFASDMTDASKGWATIAQNALSAFFALVAIVGLGMSMNLGKKMYQREEVEEPGKKWGVALLLLAIGTGSAMSTFESEIGLTKTSGKFAPLSVD